MALRQWLFDVTPPGTVLNMGAGNIVSEDGATPTTIGLGGGNAQSSDVQVHAGPTSMRIVTVGASGAIRLPFIAQNHIGAVSMYHYTPADVNTYSPLAVRHASGGAMRVGLSGSGFWALYDATGTPATGAAAQFNQWNRIELRYNTQLGNASLAVYSGNSLTPYATASHTGTNLTGNPITHIDIGMPTGSQSTTQYFDSLQMDDGRTTEIGPYIVSSSPTAVVTQQSHALVNAAGSTAGAGGTLGYSLVQNSGPSTTPINVSSGLWAIERQPSPTQWTVTVTESPSGEEATLPVTVFSAGSTSGAALDLMWDGSQWV